MSDAATLLDAAADLVDAGWCQHTMSDMRGGRERFCAIGALARTASPKNVTGYHSAVEALAGVLIEQFGCKQETIANRGSAECVTYINDYLATTGNEISTCMRKAAVDLRGTPQ